MTGRDLCARFAALGTTAVVMSADPARLAAAREAVQATVEEFDRTCSRFREDSELSALNVRAGWPVHVSSLLLEAVGAALRAAQITAGDVDPTVGEALIALGYDRDFDAVRGAREDSVASDAADASVGARRGITVQSVPGWRTIRVDREASTIRLARGVKLDLGATAKALAADRAADAAQDASGCGVLVSLGGDISICGPAPEDGWRVRVTDDHRSGVEAPGQWITMRSGGLASSSTTVRRWQVGQEGVHHLVDPATGRPASAVWRTASVAAASCLDANIASTAAIIRGLRAVGWLQQQGLPSRLVGANGTVRHLVGWPSDGDDLPIAEGELA